MRDILKKQYLWKVFSVLSVPLAIAPMVLCAMGNQLDNDPSYYLSIMERISEGKVLYQDISCGYPPVWFYMMASIKWLCHIPSGCEELYYIFHFLMQLLCAFFLFKIMRCMEIDGKVAYFCSWLFVMMGHWMEGNYLMLEIPTIMFGLLAIWWVLRYGKDRMWMLFIAGVAASFSFLCKQYGLGYCFLCLFLMVFQHKSGIIRILVFLLGFIVPVLACLAIWGQDFIANVFLNGYGTSIDEENGIRVRDKIQRIYIAAKMLFVRCAIALPVTLLFIPLFIKEKKGLQVIFCWCGVLGFLMTNYLNCGIPRYLLLALPFVMMLLALAIASTGRVNSIVRTAFFVSLAITIAYSLYADYHNRVWKLYLHPENKKKKEELAYEVSKLVPDGATLWIANSGLCHIYYLANATPPNLSTIGYSFGAGMTVEMAVKQMNAADFVLSFDWESADHYFTKEMKDYIYSHEAIYVSPDGEVVLHDMSKLKKD